MPSTRTQKPKEKRSRHPDVMSDSENLNLAYSRNEIGSTQDDRETNVNHESNGLQQSADPVKEVFRRVNTIKNN